MMSHVSISVFATLLTLQNITACKSRTFGESDTLQSGNKKFLVKNVSIVNPKWASIRHDVDVLVDNNKIVAIENTTEGRFEGMQAIDGKGRYLIPGLADMHVHTLDRETFYPLYIANGVTRVREMGTTDLNEILAWQKDVASGKLLGPRSYVTGKIVEGPMNYWPGTYMFNDPESARSAVRELKGQGAQFVKVYSMLTRDQYFAVTDEAKKLKMSVEGHVPQAVTVGEASDAGQKTMEHMYNMLEACSTVEREFFTYRAAQTLADTPVLTSIYNEKSMIQARLKVTTDAQQVKVLNLQLDALGARLQTMRGAWDNINATQDFMSLDKQNLAACQAVAMKLKANRTHVVPTLSVLQVVGSLMIAPHLKTDSRLKYIQPALSQSWPQSIHEAPNAEMLAAAKRLQSAKGAILKVFVDAGVPILAGTDVANPYVFPGSSLHDELELLVESGLNPGQALYSATYAPVKFLGENELKDYGSIEVGKRADMVLLNGNPMEDISAVRKIEAVFVEGRHLSRADLDAMLKGVEDVVRKNKESFPR